MISQARSQKKIYGALLAKELKDVIAEMQSHPFYFIDTLQVPNFLALSLRFSWKCNITASYSKDNDTFFFFSLVVACTGLVNFIFKLSISFKALQICV